MNSSYCELSFHFAEHKQIFHYVDKIIIRPIISFIHHLPAYALLSIGDTKLFGCQVIICLILDDWASFWNALMCLQNQQRFAKKINFPAQSLLGWWNHFFPWPLHTFLLLIDSIFFSQEFLSRFLHLLKLLICEELPTGATVGFQEFFATYLVFELNPVHFGHFHSGEYRWECSIGQRFLIFLKTQD